MPSVECQVQHSPLPYEKERTQEPHLTPITASSRITASQNRSH
jgi:hypothetical protein